jgi:Fe(3+) dicitrate transport protein
MVIGDPNKIEDITGSAQYIDKKTLEKNNYTDVNRVLRQVPGVNLQEEEGYGNRPNIGLRGGRSNRSADVTLMEDGVLIAPAPYAAPDAYYFPRVNRMEGVEVRKGSSTIQFGPRTTSGAINFLSSSIPQKREFELLTGYGSDNTIRGDMHYGDSVKNLGFVFDLGHDQTDGFKSIDRVGGDTGYSIQDGIAKFRINTDPDAETYQSLELKLGFTKEDSNETYLGITDADFKDDPFRRYAGSQLDNMDANHQQYQLRHYIDFQDFDVTTTLYHNDFDRNWKRLQSVTLGGNTQNISAALNSATHLAALKGDVNLDGSTTDNLTLRNNDREYYSQGIQSDIATEAKLGATDHAFQFGVRYHRDSERRFQHEDRFALNKV